MKTKADLDAAAKQAQWSACYVLNGLVGQGSGWDWSKVAQAMYHAGEAWAYYQARDAVEAADARAAKREAKK